MAKNNIALTYASNLLYCEGLNAVLADFLSAVPQVSTDSRVHYLDQQQALANRLLLDLVPTAMDTIIFSECLFPSFQGNIIFGDCFFDFWLYFSYLIGWIFLQPASVLFAAPIRKAILCSHSNPCIV